MNSDAYRSGRRVLVYFAWSRPGEVGAPLTVIENRFPSLFESRRMLYPKFHELSDPARFDQSIAGFLDHILKQNFVSFIEQGSAWSGQRVTDVERVGSDNARKPLDSGLLEGIDTLIVISFDSLRTGQAASAAEVSTVQRFLAHPDHLAFVCPHHDIGDTERMQSEEFYHHGDRTIPPQQRFGGFARSLLAGLGITVQNRFGLRPASLPDGSPAPIQIEREHDRLNLLDGVETFNLHPHLPHLERLGDAATKMDVLARQPIDPQAPTHSFVRSGHSHFDALLQSRAGLFNGDLLVSDTTLWSSTAGGVQSLGRLWKNVVQRAARG